jgi:hypothetical protein
VADGFFTFHGDDGNSFDEEDDFQQMRRLGSWSTLDTFATSASDLATSSLPLQLPPSHLLLRDDDGQVIDPALIERRRRRTKNRKGQEQDQGWRKRIVKFDYPPVTSLRECPRLDPSEVKNLFFTEEELEVFERDRESTYTADDIEIVAISSPTSSSSSPPPLSSSFHGGATDTVDGSQVREPPAADSSSVADSSSSLQPPSPSSMRRSWSASGGGGFGASFGNYISTPRVIWNKKKQHQQQLFSTRGAAPAPHQQLPPKAHRPSGVAGRSPSTASSASSPSTKGQPRQERLIKSVQIFLRERSAG